MQSLEILCILWKKGHSAGNCQLDLQIHLPGDFLRKSLHFPVNPVKRTLGFLRGNTIEFTSWSSIRNNALQALTFLSQTLQNLISYQIPKNIIDSLKSVHIKKKNSTFHSMTDKCRKLLLQLMKRI